MTSKPPKKAARALFASQLAQGRERFLAHAIEHGFDVGRRTPEDFLRHFPARAIMSGLADQPALRARILVIATGVREKVATRKSATSAGDDLQIALDETETDAETVVQLLDPDDRVRYLDHARLWAYVTEGDFWDVAPTDDAAFDRAARHTAYLIDRALVDELITERDVIEGISVHQLAKLLPRPELERVLTAVLAHAHRTAPFTDLDFLGQTPASTLVRHIPLPLIWSSVITPRIAIAHGLAPRPAAPVAATPAAAPSPARAAAPTTTAAEPTPAADARPAEAKAPEPRPAETKPVDAKPATVAVARPAAAAVTAGAGGFRVARPGDPSPLAARTVKPRRSRPPATAAPVPTTEDAPTETPQDDEVDVEIEDEP